MPELPEVETVVRDLRPLIVGRTVLRVECGKQKLRRPWKPAWSRALEQWAIAAVRRRGKWIVLDGKDQQAGSLLLHLGMTGQLTAVPAQSERQNHTHLIFPLDNGHELRFRDIRRFGSADWFATRDALERELDTKLGPEPFDVTVDAFRQSVRGSSRNLKAILLDQMILAGVGNIYADEACHRAGLRPGRTGTSLSNADCDRLRTSIVNVLTKAIAGRGSTISDYVGGSGLMGTYQGEFQVYGRTDEPCPTCGQAILRDRLAGRSSHYCPKCQR